MQRSDGHADGAAGAQTGTMEDGAGPQGWLHGMPDPRGWVHALTTHLTSVEPRAHATTGRLRSGLLGVTLTLAAISPPAVHVLLVPHPDRVRGRVWMASWIPTPPARDLQRLTFLVVMDALVVAAFFLDPAPVRVVLPPAHASPTADGDYC